jgi:hypothetical protein
VVARCRRSSDDLLEIILIGNPGLSHLDACDRSMAAAAAAGVGVASEVPVVFAKWLGLCDLLHAGHVSLAPGPPRG